MKKMRLNITIQQNDTKVINFDDVIKEEIKEYDLNWPQIPDYP